MKNILFLSICVFILASCSKKTTPFMSNVTGKAGELVVIIEPDYWQGEAGESLRGTLSQEHPGLPQREPIFDLINIPREAFGNIFKTSRNIVYADISSRHTEPSLKYQRDVYSHTQAYLTISASSSAEFSKLVNSNKDRIASFFIRAERDRLLETYKNYREIGVSNSLSEKFGINMNFPVGFRKAEDHEDFMLYVFRTPEIDQGIFVHSRPYTSESDFTREVEIEVIDSLMNLYIEGPTEGNSMEVEKRIETIYNILKINNNYSSEMRGLWKVRKDFMGGPYISISSLDIVNSRIITVCAYVYAPSKEKRNFLRQVEAMIYSLTFNNQEDIDKVLKQYD